MQKSTLALGVIVLVVIAIGFALFKSESSSGEANKDVDLKSLVSTPASTSLGSATESATINPSGSPMSTNGLVIEDIKVGTGDEAIPGKKITVNYKGTLTNGKQFDSSYDRGQPFSFNLGAGEVIQGWDQGFAGMKVGGKRKLTIPPELGYGQQGAGALIPPNSTLMFEVELLKVE